MGRTSAAVLRLTANFEREMTVSWLWWPELDVISEDDSIKDAPTNLIATVTAFLGSASPAHNELVSRQQSEMSISDSRNGRRTRRGND